MARIPGADLSRQGLLVGLWLRFVYWVVKRKLGKVVGTPRAQGGARRRQEPLIPGRRP